MTSIESVVKEMEAEMENHFSESKTTVNEYNKGLHSGIYSYIGSLLPKLKSISPQGASEGMAEAWVIEYDNDTGSGDEYFVEWFNVTNGEKSFRCNSKEDAEFLLASLSPGVEDNQTKKQ